MGSLKVKVQLENSFKVIAILDTSIIINIIIKELIEDTDLVIRKRFKLKFNPYIDHSWHFLRLYKDDEVVIRGLKTRQSIIIDKSRDHNLILDQIFLNFVTFCLEYKLDEIFSTIIHLYIY